MAKNEKVVKPKIGIFTKLIFSISGLVLIVFIITSFVLSQQVQSVLLNQLIDRGKLVTELYGLLTGDALAMKDDILLMTYMSRLKKIQDVVYASVISNESKVLMHTDVHELGKVYTNNQIVVRAVSGNEYLLQETQSETGEAMYIYSIPVMVDMKKSGVLIIAMTANSISDILMDFRNKGMMLGIFALIILIIAAFAIVSNFSKSISQLQTVAEAILSGRSQITLPVERNDEIGYLARALSSVMNHLSMAQKNAMETVQSNKKRYDFLIRKLGENFIEGIIMLDNESKVIYVNQKAAILFNLPLETSAGRHILEVNRNVELTEVIAKSQKAPDKKLLLKLNSIKSNVEAITISDSVRHEILGTIIKILD